MRLLFRLIFILSRWFDDKFWDSSYRDIMSHDVRWSFLFHHSLRFYRILRDKKMVYGGMFGKTRDKTFFSKICVTTDSSPKKALISATQYFLRALRWYSPLSALVRCAKPTSRFSRQQENVRRRLAPIIYLHPACVYVQVRFSLSWPYGTDKEDLTFVTRREEPSHHHHIYPRTIIIPSSKVRDRLNWIIRGHHWCRERKVVSKSCLHSFRHQAG